MVFSSLIFLYAFFPLSLLAYRLCRSTRAKNTVLLIFSLIFYAWGEPVYVFLLMFMALCSWFCALRVSRAENPKSAKLWVTVACVIDIALIGFFKYAGMLCGIMGAVPDFIAHIALPIGISFYTFQSMGYLIDVYREKTKPETNIARFALFVSFFPQIIQGPIAVYDDLAKQLYVGHKFDIENIKKGVLLILWGMLKKLVIADRALALVNLVTKDSSSYTGSYILFAVILYALQLYCDFSGGIDIIRGVANLFGINMAENFRRPYFSTSLTEYWHRWHITLGNWCRNYIFYPLSISKKFLNFGKWLKPKFGKHIAKVFPGCVASLITFIVIGVWHGSNLKYLYFGLWNGIVIMISELFSPINEKIADKFFGVTKLKRKGVFATVVSVLWTFILVLVGYYFDVAQNALDAFSMLFRSVTDFHISNFIWSNFEVLLKASGLDIYDFYIILIGTILLFFISLYKEKKKVEDLREVILSAKTGTRLLAVCVGIIILIFFGYYGSGIDPAEFVYMQF